MDWSDAPEWANFLAQDADGRWFWYEYLPTNAPSDRWCGYGGTRVGSAGCTEPNVNWWMTLEENKK